MTQTKTNPLDRILNEADDDVAFLQAMQAGYPTYAYCTDGIDEVIRGYHGMVSGNVYLFFDGYYLGYEKNGTMADRYCQKFFSCLFRELSKDKQTK